MVGLPINPPLLNSANPWATTYDDLLALYRCQYTGAVTTRTSTLDGFDHNDAIHRYAFFNPDTHASTRNSGAAQPLPDQNASLNNLGYSPLPLDDYLGFIERISRAAAEEAALRKDKPFIVSVTGTAAEVAICLAKIQDLARQVSMPLAMEINLSCPNIPDKPPPAYSASSLEPYLTALLVKDQDTAIPVGLKLPPYTYADQFSTLFSALSSRTPCPISFLTSTNTLGSSMLLSTVPNSNGLGTTHVPTLSSMAPSSAKNHPAVPSGLGGLAGSALHPLALGNVFSLRQLVIQNSALSHIQIIGVGGVEDADGYNRMRSVGAAAVGVGTGLGRWGVGVFEKIMTG